MRPLLSLSPNGLMTPLCHSPCFMAFSNGKAGQIMHSYIEAGENSQKFPTFIGASSKGSQHSTVGIFSLKT